MDPLDAVDAANNKVYVFSPSGPSMSGGFSYHSPVSRMDLCDEEKRATYTRIEQVLMVDQPTYYSACQAALSGTYGVEIVSRLRLLGYGETPVASAFKCADAIHNDDVTYHTLMARNEMGSYRMFIDHTTDPVIALTSVLNLVLLHQAGWLDELTKVVKVEFITFNPTLDLLSLIEVTFEIDEVGAVHGDTAVFSVPYRIGPHDALSYVRVIIEVMVCIGVALSFLSEVGDMCKSGGGVVAYLQDGWNLVDITRIVLFIVAGVYWIRIWITIDTDLSQDIGNHLVLPEVQAINTGIRFNHLQNLWETYGIVNALNLMVHLVWILKYMRHPRLAIVKCTIQRSAGDLAHFLVLFSIIFGTYSVVANLFFGASLEGYHRFGDSCAACLLIILGDTDDYSSLVQVFPFGANLFFWTFIALCTLLLFNMIIGIVVAAYTIETAMFHDGGSIFTDLGSLACGLCMGQTGRKKQQSQESVKKNQRIVERIWSIPQAAAPLFSQSAPPSQPGGATLEISSAEEISTEIRSEEQTAGDGQLVNTNDWARLAEVESDLIDIQRAIMSIPKGCRDLPVPLSLTIRRALGGVPQAERTKGIMILEEREAELQREVRRLRQRIKASGEWAPQPPQGMEVPPPSPSTKSPHGAGGRRQPHGDRA